MAWRVSKRWHILSILPTFLAFSFSFFSTNTGLLQSLPTLRIDESGGANLVLSIALPPGTGNVVPPLNLIYNSRAGNGMLGAGWNLSGLSHISRDPLRGIRYAGSDSYASSIHGSLVELSSGIYHSKKESFTRYVAEGTCGDGPCQWTVTDKAGRKFIYGATADSRTESAVGSNNIRIWSLAAVRDFHGNGYDITYEKYPDGTFAPKTITYNNRSVTFIYEDRDDDAPNYGSTASYTSSKRLKRIEIQVNGSVVRYYEAVYGMSSNTGSSRLVALKRGGSNDNGSEVYKDLSFAYSESAFQIQTSGQGGIPLFYQFRSPVKNSEICDQCATECACTALPQCSAISGIPCCPNRSYAQLRCADCVIGNIAQYCRDGVLNTIAVPMPGDIDGDGRPDIIRLTGTPGDVRLRVLRNTGTGMVDGPTSGVFPIGPGAFYRVADVDGDQRTDFLYAEGGKLKVAFSDGSVVGGGVLMNNVGVPPVPERTDENQPITATSWVADINRDARADFIALIRNSSGSVLKFYTSYGNGFAQAGSIAISTEGHEFQRFIDMNQDGIPDYVRIVGGVLRITYISESLNGGETKDYVLDYGATDGNRWLADVNADRVPDFISLDAGGNLRTQLLTSTGFQIAGSLSLGTAALKKGRTGDFNGDGRTDFAYFDGGGRFMYIMLREKRLIRFWIRKNEACPE